MSTEREAVAFLKARFDKADSEKAHAEHTLQVLRDAKRLDEATLAIYRCKQDGCLLLRVFRTLEGPAVEFPLYRLSPELNSEESNEAGREANTTDGERRWRERVAMLKATFDVQLNCDHVRYLLTESELSAAVKLGAQGKTEKQLIG